MNLHESLGPVETLHVWALLDVRLLQADLVAGLELTCLTDVPREVDVASLEANYEFLESQVLRLEIATCVRVLLRFQIDAALLKIG